MEAGLINWLRLGALGMIWGSSFMAVSIAINGFGPISVAAGRIAIGAAILFLLVRSMGLSLPSIREKDGGKICITGGLMGVMSMALPFFLLSWGQLYVASGFAGVTMAAVPLLVLPLAHFLVAGEHLTPRKALGFLVGFAGVIVLIGLDAFKSSGLGLEPLARLACFGAAACYAFGGIITKLAPKVDPFAFAAAATMLATAIIVPVAIALEGVLSAYPTIPTLAVVFLGVVPTAMANLLLVSVIRSAGPSFFSLVNYQVPIWSVVFGATFLSEKLPAQTFFALGLILMGLLITQKFSLNRRNR